MARLKQTSGLQAQSLLSSEPKASAEFDDLCLETARTLIRAKRWIASPQLLFALKQWIKELLSER